MQQMGTKGSVLHSIEEHHGDAHLPQSHWVEL